MTYPADIQVQFQRAQNAFAAIANSPHALDAKDALDTLGAALVQAMESATAEAELMRIAGASARRKTR